MLAPPTPEALQPYPNKAILKAEARVAIGPQGDLELVAENKVYESDLTTDRTAVRRVRSSSNRSWSIRQVTSRPRFPRCRASWTGFSPLRL